MTDRTPEVSRKHSPALLRPAAGPADAAAFSALRRVVTPYQVFSAARIEHSWQATPPDAHLLVLVAEVGGEIVGAARASMNVWTSEEGAASLFVMVHPDHRRQGIGGRLHEQVTAHLRALGARKVQAWGVEGDDIAGWAARRGYKQTFELRYSKLDLTDVAALPPAPPLPAGATLASFIEAGPEGVFAVDSESVLDEPGDVSFDSVSYDDWFREVWQNPVVDHEASTVVLIDGMPAAYTLVEADQETGRMWSGGTGTVRAHRGKGLAKIAKSEALRRAAAGGITAAYTSNDEVNHPMLAINEWLGYRACAAQFSYLRSE
jgi:RimJ/RimL family protein N-acetyltransferase